MASQDWLEKDFYQILGVSKDVNDADLKKTYRKLARKYHPDSNPGDAAAEAQFKEMSEAYSVLSDKEQRADDVLRHRFPVGAAEPAPAVTSLEELAAGTPLRLPDAAPERTYKLTRLLQRGIAGVARSSLRPSDGAHDNRRHLDRVKTSGP